MGNVSANGDGPGLHAGASGTEGFACKPGPSPFARRGVYALFALVTLAAALGNLSQTGLNAMLPAVMDEFGVAVDVGQWLTTGYMLVLGVAVPVATFLMRRFDDRGYVLLGFGLFAAGSLVCWVAPEFFTELFGRVVQAAAVGLLVPKMQTIAMTQFPPGRQATAMGVAGIALGFAPNIGPTVGGAMDSAFGWRSFFLLLFVLSALLFALTFPLVERAGQRPRSPLSETARFAGFRTTGYGGVVQRGADGEPVRFETLSFVLSTLGFGGVLLGLSQASSYGFASAWVWVPIAVGTVCLALFVRRQRVVAQPLMDLRIFSSRQFVGGLVASVFLFASYMGVTLVLPLYVQMVLGGSSLDAGLVILPATFTALFVNPLAGVLADKASARLASVIFGAFLVAGSVASVFIDERTPLWVLSVMQTTRAIGVSGLIGPLVTYSLAGLKGPLVPHGSTATVIVRQVAATFGTALMVFCVTAVGGILGMLSPVPYQVAMAFSAVMSLACLGVVVARVR